MVNNIREPLPAEDEQSLRDLSITLAAIRNEIKTLKTQETKIVSQIKAIVEKYDLPVELGVTQRLYIPELDQELKVTRPEKTPKIDPLKLLDRIPLDIFMEVCTITSVDIDLREWDKLEELELVKESDLLDSIIPVNPDAPEELRLSVAPVPKNAGQDGD